MSRVRSRAIKEIFDFWPRIEPVDQVVLAVKHNVPDWLPLAYAVLCQRNDPIEVDEAKKLGLETMVFLAKAREKVRRASIASRPTSPDPTPFSASLVSRVIDEIFWPAPKSPDPKCEETMLPPEVESAADTGIALEEADPFGLATGTGGVPQSFTTGSLRTAPRGVFPECNAKCQDYDKEPTGGSWNQTTIRIFDVVKDDLKLPQAKDECAGEKKEDKDEDEDCGLPAKKGKKKKGKLMRPSIQTC